MYSNIVNVFRLKNKAQQMICEVKLAFKSAKVGKDILETGEISIFHLNRK